MTDNTHSKSLNNSNDPRLGNLPYDLNSLTREQKKYYIGASEEDQKEMLKKLDLTSLEGLFSHIDQAALFKSAPDIGSSLEYAELVEHLEKIAAKNTPMKSFLGDGLKAFIPNDIIGKVASIRGLTTAYTPYQPERSQGTLYSLWFYSSCIRELTGFEAINASLYERSTCLFEAIQTAKRLLKGKATALIPKNIYPQDRAVLKTLSEHTPIRLVEIEVDQKTGQIDLSDLENKYQTYAEDACALVFAQANNLGVLEDVDQLTDWAREKSIKSIAIVDPIALSNNGLKAPSKFGAEAEGCDMIVAEGQHLAIGPNYGGPGLGIFGIRFHEKDKVSIRSTAGRYIGEGRDQKGNSCLTMVLSTREQHIRREKATSNICSNQSFVATLAGANMLNLGAQGMAKKFEKACQNARDFLSMLSKDQIGGLSLAFENQCFSHEIAMKLDLNRTQLIQLIDNAAKKNLLIGVDLSERIKSLSKDQSAILMSFYDHHTAEDLRELADFFKDQMSNVFSISGSAQALAASEIPAQWKRAIDEAVAIKSFDEDQLVSYYQSLGQLNFSPDDNLYPLGSCTMKYNPYVNDYAASLAGFTNTHPQAPEHSVQGNLQILFEIQEMFKTITGLAGVTTQPVAGAQGELVGIKMFQAYHADRGEMEQRDMILIPRSAHGTNPATATMAGFESKKIDGRPVGIVNIDADEQGQIDLAQVQEVIEKYSKHIAGIMVTNPNTSGIFEGNFAKVAELVHKAGGLVYMDGANMNAIASWVDLDKIGVDAVHNNLHKTWTIPHGGGGPGDAIVAVSEKLVPFMPGLQFKKGADGVYSSFEAEKTIGHFHRHVGNFAHKVRCYTYLKALGSEGIRMMAANAVLSSRYLFENLSNQYPFLPASASSAVRMHEFIITLSEQEFEKLVKAGTPKAKAIAQVGKLFLDFGMHPPTVAFPEVYGLMIEPTESFSKAELDRFLEVLMAVKSVINERPELVKSAPHLTPIMRVDEVAANKNLILGQKLDQNLPVLPEGHSDIKKFNDLPVKELAKQLYQHPEK